MDNYVKAVAIKYKKVTIYNSTFLYIPDGIIKGDYDLRDKNLTDDLTEVNYGIIDDECLYYSELEYGYYNDILLKTLKEENPGLEEVDILNNYYLEHNKDLYIMGIDLDNNIINKKISLENLFKGKFTEDDENSLGLFAKASDELKNYYYDANNEDDIIKLNKAYDTLSEHISGMNKLRNKIGKKICKQSVEIIDVVEEDIVEEEQNKESFNLKEISKYIKDTVIGQDDHIDRIITEIYKLTLESDNKSGLLLTGPTGVGKTKILTMLSKKMNRPFLLVDSTQITIAGYVGKSIEDCLYDLYIRENKDKERVEQAIICFDEIDKKGSSNNKDVSHRAVLNSLLKFLDGTYYTIKGNVNIDTSNMIFIAAGAFSNVYKDKGNTIGFFESDNKTDKITIDDFIELGGMPDEFMGRLPISIRLNELDKDKLKEILIKSNESPIKKEAELFGIIGTDLRYDDTYINAVALAAIERKTGARSLTSIVKESTWKAFQDAMDNDYGASTIILTEDTVKNPYNFKVIENPENNKVLIKK